MSGETRQKILDVCEQLIETLGLARVTTKEIARATGLSEGALYRHFDHKEDVYLAVFEEHVRALLGFLGEHTAGQGEAADNLREIGLAILHYYEQLVPLTASFFADTGLLVRFRELLERIGEPERLHYLVAMYIEDEQRLERITPELPALSIATSLLGPVFQYAFLRQLTGHDQFGQTDQQFVENLVQVLAPSILPSGERRN
jgi:AcrR family transcriptional regulator